MIVAFFEGLVLQASLILALGAQNLFIIDSGLKKRRPLLVAVVCSICDTGLIFLGVFGTAVVLTQFPFFKMVLALSGIGFLAYYGILKISESFSPVSIQQVQISAETARQVILASLGFSLLNPHVYLDTLVLIGGYSTQFNQISIRFSFGAGAAFVSVVWFFGLTTLATLASSLFSKPAAVKRLSFASGALLLVLAAKLVFDFIV